MFKKKKQEKNIIGDKQQHFHFQRVCADCSQESSSMENKINRLSEKKYETSVEDI